MDHSTTPKRKASPTPQPQPPSSITTWNAINSPASTASTPPSRFSTASGSSTAGRRKKKPTLRSNFEARHDHVLETVVNSATGSTTRDWKPDTSPVVLSSKASQAAYKGWQNRKGGTPASSPAASTVPAPAPPPIQLPPFSSLPPSTLPAAGPSYIAMPAGFGGLELARGPPRPGNGVEQVQKVEDEARKALKRHLEAYTPGEHMMERAKKVAKAEQKSEKKQEGGEEDGEKDAEKAKGDVPETESEEDGAARE